MKDVKNEEEFKHLKEQFIIAAQNQIDLLLNTNFEDLRRIGTKSKLAQAHIKTASSYVNLTVFLTSIKANT